MKAISERTQTAPVQLTSHPLNNGTAGKTMSPPTFQLWADSGSPTKKESTSSKVVQREPNSCQESDVKSSLDTDLKGQYCEYDEEAVKWGNFAHEFNSEFLSILHAFEPAKVEAPEAASTAEGGETAKPTGKAKAKPKGKPGTKSGANLDWKQAKLLFTEGQREKLMLYMTTGEIPERLFNGDEVGNTTAQQRILMSGQILSKGKYKPGSFEQGIHARMCYHFVQITHHYAGATSKASMTYTGGNAHGMKGNFDHSGGVLFGTAKTTSLFEGSKNPKDLLPEEEGEGIGPIPEETNHAAGSAKEDEKIEAGKKKKASFHRRAGLPWERFGEIKPGDWLWYYNANGSAGGAHSVIFSRWASEPETIDGVNFRVAICYSQGQVKNGGREHTVRLGDKFHKNGKIKISPITWVSRVNEDARPAQSADEILPKRSEKKEAQLGKSNKDYIKFVERKTKKPVDVDAIKAALRKESNEHINKLSPNLTLGQFKMLREVNRSESIEDLVKLLQRLRELSNNSQLLESNTKKTFDDKLNDKHAAVAKKMADAEADAQAKLDAIDAELNPMVARLQQVEKDQSALVNPTAEMKKLYAKAGKMKREIRAMKRKKVAKDDPKMKAAIEAREEVLEKIEDLKKARTKYFGDKKALRKEFVALTRSARKLGWKKDAVNKKLRKEKATVPYGMVHSGGLKHEKKIKVSGRLKEIYNYSAMKGFTIHDAE